MSCCRLQNAYFMSSYMSSLTHVSLFYCEFLISFFLFLISLCIAFEKDNISLHFVVGLLRVYSMKLWHQVCRVSRVPGDPPFNSCTHTVYTDFSCENCLPATFPRLEDEDGILWTTEGTHFAFRASSFLKMSLRHETRFLKKSRIAMRPEKAHFSHDRQPIAREHAIRGLSSKYSKKRPLLTIILLLLHN